MSEPMPSAGPSALDFTFDESVGYLLARVRTSMASAVNKHTMAALGLTSTQASILFLLATGRCVVAAELARENGIDASAVTRLIDRLEQRGLLARERSETDRRVVHLTVTPEGHRFAEQIKPIYMRVLEQMLMNFSAEEVGYLKSMLRRILSNGCPNLKAAN